MESILGRILNGEPYAPNELPDLCNQQPLELQNNATVCDNLDSLARVLETLGENLVTAGKLMMAFTNSVRSVPQEISISQQLETNSHYQELNNFAQSNYEPLSQNPTSFIQHQSYYPPPAARDSPEVVDIIRQPTRKSYNRNVETRLRASHNCTGGGGYTCTRGVCGMVLNTTFQIFKHGFEVHGDFWYCPLHKCKADTITKLYHHFETCKDCPKCGCRYSTLSSLIVHMRRCVGPGVQQLACPKCPWVNRPEITALACVLGTH